MSAPALDRSLIDLASGVIDLAGNAPLPITRISATLPMEFALDRQGQITARPPFALQSRDLALPVAQMRVTFDVNGGPDV